MGQIKTLSPAMAKRGGCTGKMAILHFRTENAKARRVARDHPCAVTRLFDTLDCSITPFSTSFTLYEGTPAPSIPSSYSCPNWYN